MTLRTLGMAVLCLLMLPLVSAAPAHALPGQNTASETYYTLDVESGRIEARVEAEVQTTQSGDVDKAILWAMPLARNIQVTRDGNPLDFERIDATGDSPVVVNISLDEPLRGALTRELTMTYTVPAGETAMTNVAPGAIESMFVSQGRGSFVLIDVPAAADNVLDPGCLLAADQPADVRDAGYQRWVCGDAALIALNSEDESIQRDCAAMADRCRQSVTDLPFSAFAQSVIDDAAVNRLQGTVDIGGGGVPLELKYFAADGEWANAQFDVAMRALPRLEALFGFAYPNDRVLLRQSHHIGFLGAAGLAFSESGEMLIVSGSGFDEYVTVHELAHQWVGRNLESSWLWEGLAEWAARTVAPELGIDVMDRPWESFEHDDPLATWHHGSSVANPDYWYGKAGDFFFAYEQAIGGRENMTKVLSRLDDDLSQLPADGRWFMDMGEDVSGANLDDLFLEWVWNEPYGESVLGDRRAAHALVDALVADASAEGLEGVPPGIQRNLRNWTFGSIEAQVEEARENLQAYRDLQLLVAENGLQLPADLASSWSHAPMSAFASTLREHEQVIELMAGAERDLVDAAEDVGTEPSEALEDARAAYNEGDLDSASDFTSQAREAVYTIRGSERMIRIAEIEQESYSENFVRRIGLLGKDPAADLAAAREAYEAGDHGIALEKAQAAYHAWNGATSAGYMRLGMLAGALCALIVLVWWLLARIDRGDGSDNRSIHDRHHIEEPDQSKRPPRWRDWENNP